MVGTVLDGCPRCSYSLKGLPQEHACPECGLRYDGKSRAWRKAKWWPGLILLAFAAFPAHNVLEWLAEGAQAPGWITGILLVVSFLFLIVFLLVGLPFVYRQFWHGVVVAATPAGLYFGPPGEAEGALTEWDNFEKVEIKPKNSVWVFFAGREPVKVFRVFQTDADAEAFATLARHYGQKAPETCPADARPGA